LHDLLCSPRYDPCKAEGFVFRDLRTFVADRLRHENRKRRINTVPLRDPHVLAPRLSGPIHTSDEVRNAFVETLQNLEVNHKRLFVSFLTSMMAGETQQDTVERIRHHGVPTNQSYISRLRKGVFSRFWKNLEENLLNPA
jgi:hypothetical protein